MAPSHPTSSVPSHHRPRPPTSTIFVACESCRRDATPASAASMTSHYPPLSLSAPTLCIPVVRLPSRRKRPHAAHQWVGGWWERSSARSHPSVSVKQHSLLYYRRCPMCVPDVHSMWLWRQTYFFLDGYTRMLPHRARGKPLFCSFASDRHLFLTCCDSWSKKTKCCHLALRQCDSAISRSQKSAAGICTSRTASALQHGGTENT